jgi:protocadherin-15
VGTTIYSNIKATDIDAGVNGLVEYFLVEGSHHHNDNNNNITILSDDKKVTADGFGTFQIAYPHQGHVSDLIQLRPAHLVHSLNFFFLLFDFFTF